MVRVITVVALSSTVYSRPHRRDGRCHMSWTTMKYTTITTSEMSISANSRIQPRAPLSLRFNHEGFCDVLYLHRKTLAVTVFVGSGALLEGRVALGLAGEPAFGPPRRPTAGFRRLGGRAQVRQKRRNGAMDPDRRKTPRIVAALPRQPQVRNARARQPELGESYHNQPRPPVGLLGVAYPRRRPSHALLEKAKGVFQIETPHIRAPDEVQVRPRPFRSVPPQP